MEELVEIFKSANKRFIKRDTNLIMSDVSERCLCGALMLFLHNEIQNSDYRKYYTDIEYNRNKGEIKTIINNKLEVVSITCDVIVHSRGENISQDNLIAIEMKKTSALKSEKTKDKDRLLALTKDRFDDVWSFDGKTVPEHVCRYLLGIYYELNICNRYIDLEYYSSGSLKRQERITF